MSEVPSDSIKIEIPAPPAAPEPTSAPVTQAAPAPEASTTATPAATPAAPTLSAEAQAYQHERNMFVAGAEATGQTLPGNFSDFGSYFDSLKSAQGEYTKARQELAELKKAQEAPATEAPAEAKPEDKPKGDEELLIKEPKAEEPEAEASSDDEYEVVEVGVDEETWNNWGAELDATGTLSEDTNSAILKAFPGVTQDMINMYVQGRKAMLQTSYSSAAEVVGGKENLSAILDWAGKTFSAEERSAMNAALQSAARDSTLLGLKARYDSSTARGAKASEPSVTPNRVLSSQTQSPITPFANQAEMTVAMRDSRYGVDPKFTAEIQQRLAKTTWLYGG
jgi:hypothetical protein